jgi:RimJ/RimL family protein N-acetyltransferase
MLNPNVTKDTPLTLFGRTRRAGAGSRPASPDDAILGHIEFFKTVNYLDEYELSYQVYLPEHRGKGVAMEAVQLLLRYLFESKRVNRIRLVIHPGNLAPADSLKDANFSTKALLAVHGITRGSTRTSRSTRSCTMT